MTGTEIKFSFSTEWVAAAREKFGLRKPDAEPCDVYFLDMLVDGDPRLLTAGVVLRLRARTGKSGNRTLKLRPADAGKLTGRWQPETSQDPGYRVEFDWAKQQVLAASLDREIEAGQLDAVISGDVSPKHAFTGRQREFLDECGPALAKPFRDLRVAGPIAALRWSDVDWPGDISLHAEQWKWGDNQKFLELSLRVADSTQAASARDALEADIERRNLTISDDPTTKTEAVLRALLATPNQSGEIALSRP
jgi:hypothetical protein